MNVAILTRGDLFPPIHGAAVKIVRTAEALARRGLGVCLLSEDRDTWRRWEEGTWRAVPYPARARAVEEWPPLPLLLRRADRICARIGYPPEEHFLYRPLVDPSWLVRALAVGLAEDVAVFHAEFPGYGVPATVAARLLGVRAVVVEHNVEYDRLAQMAGVGGRRLARLRAVETRILAAADDVVTVSRADRDLLVRAGLEPTGVTVIPHGVDLEPFDAARTRRAEHRAWIRARYGVGPDDPLLVFHGVLHYAPNADAVRILVEDLLPALLPEFPRLRILVGGMNPPRYFDHPAVILPGVLPDLAPALVAADLAVCPLRMGGGTRMKILEYLAAGLPVVSTAKGAEGLLCRDGEEIALAELTGPFVEAVTRLLRDASARRRLGKAGARFAGRFGWDRVAEAYVDLYTGRGRGRDWNEILAETPSVAADPPAEPVLLLLVNRRCNLRCAFCGFADPGTPGRDATLAVDRAPDLFAEARAIGVNTVVLTGGEPLLHPGLFRIVQAARAAGLGVNLTTNGTLVSSRFRELLRDPPDSVSVSLDGLEPTHDALRGRPGAFAEARDALVRLRDHGIATSVYFVITSRNLEDLPAVHALAGELGASFDCWPVNEVPDLAIRDEALRTRYRALVDDLARKDPHLAARRGYLLGGLDYHAGGLGPVRCRGLVEQLGVTPEGDLLPCCVWGARDLVVGNVFEQPLSQLWRSAAVERARTRLDQEGCAIGCYNHSLFRYEEATGRPYRVGSSSGRGSGSA